MHAKSENGKICVFITCVGAASLVETRNFRFVGIKVESFQNMNRTVKSHCADFREAFEVKQFSARSRGFEEPLETLFCGTLVN